MNAMAVLSHPEHPAVSGSVHFTCDVGGVVTIRIEARGLPRGVHGVAIYTLGNMLPGAGLGGHFNPHKAASHGGLRTDVRHAGDLGNVYSQGHSSVTQTVLKNVPLLISDIVGRAVVIHAEVDDEGSGGTRESKVSGNAGAQLARGVIGRALR